MANNNFLYTNKNEFLGNSLDIILISGNAYVDHPSFGSSLIGRYLQSIGFKVGIIPQPDINRDEDFTKLGTPRLFFAVSSGNMDSMVNHYTANKKLRSSDAYSPNGKMGLRPDRAVMAYTQKLKQLFKNIPIVLGGIEASMRRIPHYDYWQDKLKNSILIDSKADILVYGMAEQPLAEIAFRLDKGNNNLADINQTVSLVKDVNNITNKVEYTEFSKKYSKQQYWQLTKLFNENYANKTIIAKHQNRFLRHNPPYSALSQKQLDDIYALPFLRKVHPMYKGQKIPAFEQIKHSVTSHRGCFGSCNFCTIGYHQGKKIQSRSEESILAELKTIANLPYFKGTITDIGGPSADMYGFKCKLDFNCQRPSCLVPSPCPNLISGRQQQQRLFKEASKINKIKHIFIASGIRYDLALEDKEYIKNVVAMHTGGHLKLAPEHISDRVLKLMNKPSFKIYEEFEKQFTKISKALKKEQYIVPYIIVGHPGATLNDTILLASYLKKRKIKLRQIQQFTPTPMTISTAMYACELNFYTDEKIHVAKGRELKIMKALIQWYEPKNKPLIIEALKKAKQTKLLSFFYSKKI